jgi:hypothetical protein
MPSNDVDTRQKEVDAQRIEDTSFSCTEGRENINL